MQQQQAPSNHAVAKSLFGVYLCVRKQSVLLPVAQWIWKRWLPTVEFASFARQRSNRIKNAPNTYFMWNYFMVCFTYLFANCTIYFNERCDDGIVQCRIERTERAHKKYGTKYNGNLFSARAGSKTSQPIDDSHYTSTQITCINK